MKFLPSLLFCVLAASCGMLEPYRDITDTRIVGDKLYVNGTLNALTFDEIENIIETNPDLRTVVLEEIDGSIDDEINLQTGLLIHNAGLDTYVMASSDIQSGAVDIFCAGINRYAETGARIGVHSWADGSGLEGGDLPDDDESHDEYVHYFEVIGCPVEFYWYTLDAAPADDMHFMSQAELLRYKVVTEFVSSRQ